MTQLAETSGGPIASPAARLGAYILDVGIGLVLAFVLMGVAGAGGGGSIGARLAFGMVGYIAIGAWFWSRGSTPGKMMLGMRVVNAQTGVTAGFFTMLVREMIGKWISGFFLGLGWIWILIDGRNQGWHDKLVDTTVVSTR